MVGWTDWKLSISLPACQLHNNRMERGRGKGGNAKTRPRLSSLRSHHRCTGIFFAFLYQNLEGKKKLSAFIVILNFSGGKRGEAKMSPSFPFLRINFLTNKRTGKEKSRRGREGKAWGRGKMRRTEGKEMGKVFYASFMFLVRGDESERMMRCVRT